MKRSQGKINMLKTFLLQRLCGCLFPSALRSSPSSSSCCSAVAMNVFQRVVSETLTNLTRVYQQTSVTTNTHIFQCVLSATLGVDKTDQMVVMNSNVCFVMDILTRFAKTAVAATGTETTTSTTKGDRKSYDHKQSYSNQQSWQESLWSTTTVTTGGVDSTTETEIETEMKPYDDWICNLVHVLIRENFFFETMEGDEEGALNASNTGAGVKLRNTFIRSLADIVLLDDVIAEAIFPVVILELCRAPAHTPSGQQQKWREIISKLFINCLLSSTCPSTRATKLACETLVFLHRQEIKKCKESGANRNNTSNNTNNNGGHSSNTNNNNSSSSSNNNNGNMPILPVVHSDDDKSFSYLLAINPQCSAAAALRCGLSCSALLFLEMTSAFSNDTNHTNIVTPSTVTSIHTNPNTNSMMTASASATDPDLLINILKLIHDPDAVCGVRSYSLSLQSLQYLASGHPMQALASYESMIAQNQSAACNGNTHDIGDVGGGSGVSTEILQGISSSLAGLGCETVSKAFSAYLSSYGSSSYPAMSTTVCSAPRHSFDQCQLQWNELESNISSQHPTAVESLSSWHIHDPTANTTISATRASTATISRKSSLLSTSNNELLDQFLHANINNTIQSFPRQNTITSSRTTLATTLSLVDICNDVLCDMITKRRGDETAVFLIPALIKLQNIHEVYECKSAIYTNCSLMKPYTAAAAAAITTGLNKKNTSLLSIHINTTTNSTNHTQQLLNKWRHRRIGHRGESLQNMSLLSYRVTLIQHLLRTTPLSRTAACDVMKSILTMIPHRNAEAAHTLSPLVYRLKSVIVASVNNNINSHQSSTESLLVHVTWSLYEGQFLWMKGLTQVAQLFVDEKVIHVLQSFFQSSSSSSSSSTARNNNSSSLECIKKLYIEALRIRGEWLIEIKGTPSYIIYQKYLEPARQTDVDAKYKLQVNLSLGQFNASLYRSSSARTEGREWLMKERFMSDRRAEFDRCCQILAKENKDRQNDKAKSDADYSEDTKNLIRHIQILRKEIELDEADKRSVLRTTKQYLIEALANICTYLAFSTQLDLDVVVELVDLWLSNWDHQDVNSLLQNLLTNIPSFKFVSLTYQIFSRLENNNSNDHATILFQRVLTQLIYRMCCEHPHQTVWQLFSLANADLVDSSIYKSNISTSRCDAAKALIQRLKDPQRNVMYKDLILSMEKLLMAYITLAEASTEKFQKANKIKGITFRELTNDRSQQPFNECIVDMKAAMPVIPTLMIPVRPDREYTHVVRLSRFASSFSISDTGLSRPKIIEW